MNRKEVIVDELNLIQTQVQRMANNSFIIKGWYVTFMSTFIAYMITQDRIRLIGWGVIPILACALYDGYFLHMERLYREKYNWVKNNVDKNDNLFNLNPYEEGMQNKKVSYKDALFSKLVMFFYFLPMVVFIFIA